MKNLSVFSLSNMYCASLTDTNSTFIWLLIIGCVCGLGIFIIVIILCKNSKKHGQYSFVPGNASDCTDIPMTPTSAGEKA